MANTLKLYARYDPGTGVAFQEVLDGEKLYFQKSGAFAYGSGGAITVDAAQGGTHIIDAANAELCDTAHPSNVEYVASGTCKINGGEVVNVNTVAENDCFRFTGDCSPNAEVTAASFFAYGAAEADAVSGVTVYGVKQGAAAWADIGGSAAEYDLGSGESAAQHNRYVAISVIPTSNGAKTGTLKGEMTFV